MKKLIFLSLLLLGLVFATTPVIADIIYPPDLLIDSGSVAPPSNANETNWTETAILDYDPDAEWIAVIKFETPAAFPSDLTSLVFEPGFEWTYAMVKIGVAADPFLFLYKDMPGISGSDNVLNVPGIDLAGAPVAAFSQGISHVTFYKTADIPQVPEPVSLLLLGLGLVGLAGARRKFKK